MKYLIIDGHNAINLIPALAGHRNRCDEERRKALIVFITEWRVVRLFPGNITIVFDSKHAENSTMKTIQGIKCIFATSRQDADEKIKSIIRGAQDPHDVTVITHDNNIGNSCRIHGATIGKPQTYFQVPGNKKTKEVDGNDKKIGIQAENDITNMLKKKYGII